MVDYNGYIGYIRKPVNTRQRRLKERVISIIMTREGGQFENSEKSSFLK